MWLKEKNKAGHEEMDHWLRGLAAAIADNTSSFLGIQRANNSLWLQFLGSGLPLLASVGNANRRYTMSLYTKH